MRPAEKRVLAAAEWLVFFWRAEERTPERTMILAKAELIKAVDEERLTRNEP